MSNDPILASVSIPGTGRTKRGYVWQGGVRVRRVDCAKSALRYQPARHLARDASGRFAPAGAELISALRESIGLEPLPGMRKLGLSPTINPSEPAAPIGAAPASGEVSS